MNTVLKIDTMSTITRLITNEMVENVGQGPGRKVWG